jgi:hypothetical protein
MSKRVADMTADELEDQRRRRREYAKRYRAANPDVPKRHNKAHHAANRQANLARMKKYYSANSEAIRERNRQWRISNLPQIRGKQCRYHARRMARDINYRLACLLRARLVATLRRGRAGSAVRDLGMTIAEFKAHMESQFLPGMTWDNWGKVAGTWQIDHLYPLAAADLTDRAQLLAVCNYRNLQPLWFADNNAKGDSVSPAAQALFDELVSLFQGGE